MIIRYDIQICREGEIDVSYEQLRVIKNRGVDMLDDFAVADEFKSLLGKKVDGVWFPDLCELADEWHSQDTPELMDEWWPEGEIPESLLPEED